MDEHADILSLFNVSRQEIFSSASNSILLFEKGKRSPCGEIYFKDEKFGVRFGDYKLSPIQKVLT